MQGCQFRIGFGCRHTGTGQAGHWGLSRGCGVPSSSCQQGITPLLLGSAVREGPVLQQRGLGWKMCSECRDGVTQDSVEQEAGWRGVVKGQSRTEHPGLWSDSLFVWCWYLLLQTATIKKGFPLSPWREKKQFWDYSPLNTEYPCMERML